MKGRFANPLNHGRSWSVSFRERYYARRDEAYQEFCRQWDEMEAEYSLEFAHKLLSAMGTPLIASQSDAQQSVH